MRKKIFVIVLLATSLFSPYTSYAEEDSALDAMGKKFRSGVTDLFTGPAEFPYQILKGYKKRPDGKAHERLYDVLAGIPEGMLHSFGRTLSGAMNIVGFWAADPKENKNIGLPLDAEYVWEEGEPYDMFSPDFIDATIAPVINKLFRGAGNTLFGFMEVPKQITKGLSNKSPDIGIAKGLWYWLSREISGISDIITFPLPAPEQPVGVLFEDEWGWDRPRIKRQEQRFYP